MLDDPDDGGFFAAEPAAPFFQPRGVRLQRLDRRTVHVGVEDRGVDIAFAADRFRVAQPFGDRFDGPDDIALRFRGRFERRDLGERLRREHGTGPRAKILRCEFLLCNLL